MVDSCSTHQQFNETHAGLHRALKRLVLPFSCERTHLEMEGVVVGLAADTDEAAPKINWARTLRIELPHPSQLVCFCSQEVLVG